MKRMFKLSTTLFFMYFCICLSFGQIENVTVEQDSLILQVTTPDSDGNGDSTCNLELVITNESSESIPLKWKKRVITNSQPTWHFHVCDENNCFIPAVDSAQIVLSHSDSNDLYAGWSAFSVGFDDGINTVYDGYAEVEFTISKVEDPESMVKVIFIFDGQDITATYDVKDFQEISVFPNPSADYLNLAGDIGKQASQVIIYDLNGQVAINTKFQINQAIDVTNLTVGSYVVAILDKNKKLIARESFNKL